jgi:threonine/homoserine/homoserine lactone efflux protein
MLLPLLQGISFATAPLLSISPFKIFLLSSAIRQGWRKALPLATVPLVGDLPIILTLWLLVRQLPDWGLEGLRIAGGLFYLHLAIGLFRGARRSLSPEALGAQSRQSYRQAVVAIWISPNVYINWGSIGIPALLGYSEQSAAHAALFLIGFYVVWVGGLGLQIVVAGQAGRFPPRSRTVLAGAGSLLLVGFGLRQVWLGMTRLLAG